MIKELALGKTIDLITNLDISGRGSIEHLYKLALTQNGEVPLSFTAAEKIIAAIKPKDKVFLTTGWIDQPAVAPGYGETDGPLGTLVLARALRKACKACIIIYTDEQLVEGLKMLAQVAGFHCVAPDLLEESIVANKLMTLSILPFPTEPEKAQQKAVEMLSTYKPVCLIAVERGGLNEVGKIHNMLGYDTSLTQAKVDYLFIEANKQKLLTIAIGDGGNEIGMANIKAGIKKSIKNGARCVCDCGLGISPSTEVELLVTATISNWGCYAIVAMLAAKTRNVGLLHQPKIEKQLLTTAIWAGFHDAMFGSLAMSVDNCADVVHYSIITLLNEATTKYLDS